jgi:hypothetical protein
MDGLRIHSQARRGVDERGFTLGFSSYLKAFHLLKIVAPSLGARVLIARRLIRIITGECFHGAQISG